jgi:hypothetical protein
MKATSLPITPSALVESEYVLLLIKLIGRNPRDQSVPLLDLETYTSTSSRLNLATRLTENFPAPGYLASLAHALDFSHRIRLSFYSWLLSLGLIPAAVENVPRRSARIRRNLLAPIDFPDFVRAKGARSTMRTEESSIPDSCCFGSAAPSSLLTDEGAATAF